MVLGTSSYTFAETTWSQQLPDGLGPHARCLAFLGGLPTIVVPDNLRSAESKSRRYEPDINSSYRDVAEHYGAAVVSALARKPRDRAKAEVGVQLVERWGARSAARPSVFLLGRTQQCHCGAAGATQSTAISQAARLPAILTLPRFRVHQVMQPSVHSTMRQAQGIR
ncbi:hypothetical protein HNP46_006564 [Pseudomonas nitritireducens]|uniref:Transposase n=1 Tax=Pseudomonas nitroreducens TaxID=46680 RepID=A0A7W7KSC1_PSENT|nr:hypothetical protein [Pseudomonas nitritireducens]